MKDYNYNYIYKSDILKGYNTYFNRLLNLIYSYLEGLFDDSSDPKEACEAEKNMLAAGFYAHYAEMKDVYKKMGEGKNRLIFDYVAGMSDNFALDCANEILKPEHLNDKIELSLRGKWFDA